MKNLYLFVLLLALPFSLLAQNIHGIWTGTLVNDSTHRTQNFELGLSEYRGKITGYTYTTFIDNDTFYYSIKRIKAERKDGKLIIQDVEMVGNNFPQKAAKRVKQTTTFPLINDSTIDITSGRWTTNQTKTYYSIGGSATIKEQEEEKESDLLAHLQEMNVKTDIAVHQKEKSGNEPIAKNSWTPKKQQGNNSKTAESNNADLAKNSRPPASSKTASSQTNNIQKPEEIKTATGRKDAVVTAENSADKGNNKATQNTITEQEPAHIDSHAPQNDLGNANKTASEKNPLPGTNNTQKTEALNSIASSKKPSISTNSNPENENNTSVQHTVAKQGPPSTNHTEQNNTINSNKSATEYKPVTQIPVSQQKKTTDQPVAQKKDQAGMNNIKELPSVVAERKNETIQNIYFKNDSLVLSLYDNGIVDGDTVSVFMNGENIVSKQKLKEAATKKTIYISSNMDSVQLVLFAENLGSIPPNTGLLTVRDGDEIYQVRFSADLQKNASIILRRRKDQ